MRRCLYFVVFGFCLLGLLAGAHAQDAGKIIDQYVKAAGGAKGLSKIQTLSLEGTLIDSASGKSGAYTFDTRLPNHYYSEILVGDAHFIDAYNGKSAWREDPASGVRTLLGTDAVEMAATARYTNARLLNLKKNKLTAVLKGHATIRGKDALEMDLTSASGVARRIFFDAQSHLIVKEIAPIGGIEQEILYDDYRPVAGIQISHKLELRRGTDSYEIIVRRAAVNEQVGERVFDFPRKSQVQFPDLKALFKEIDANQKAIDKIKENYAGTQVTEETEYDGAGKVKKRESSEHTFFYLNGREVSTLVKKDGKPLTGDEQKKENERVQKRIQEIQQREAKKEAKEEKAKEEGKQEKQDDVGIEVFLHSSQFVNPRRERFRGQDVLVFDFEPNPDFKPHSLVEKLAHSLAGVVWVDEQAHDVARLEAYFADSVKIGGGLLASVQKGTSFVFEQAFVNNEVWLPTYEEAHIGARFLLVKGFHMSEVTRYFDYRRFNVESLSTIAAPKAQ